MLKTKIKNELKALNKTKDNSEFTQGFKLCLELMLKELSR